MGAACCGEREILGTRYLVYAVKVKIASYEAIGRALRGVPDRCVAQVFERHRLPGLSELVLAAHYVFRSFSRGANVLRSRHYELMLYVTKKRQFKDAVKASEVIPGDEPKCMVMICEGSLTGSTSGGCDSECCPQDVHGDIIRQLAEITEFYLREMI